MIDDVLRSLADELTPTSGVLGQRSSLRMRQGVIVSVDPGGTVTVTIGGDATELVGVRVAEHVNAYAGATCWLLSDGRDAFVVAILGSASPFPFRMAAGRRQITGSGTFQKTEPVVFPVGLFTVPPIVTFGNEATTTATGTFVPSHENVTAAGFTLRLKTSQGTNYSSTYNIGWIAVQMLPTAAES